jgi:hypothetical protein
MARLVIYPRTPLAREILLKPGENLIGRGFANDVRLEDASVSGSHCQITVDGADYLLRDLGSTNGTFLNGVQVKEAALAPGHTVHLGSVEALFDADGAIASAAMPMPSTLAATATLAHAVSPPVISSAPTTVTRRPAAVPPAATTIPPGETSAETQACEMNAPCKFHPKSPARWSCPKCAKFFCDLCVGTRAAAGRTAHVCRSCGVECAPVAVKASAPRATNFFAVLPGTFAYPFQNGGTILLICAAAFMAVVEILKSFSWYLQIIFMGYMFAYMQNVIHTTAGGDEHKPSLPDISNIFSDIILPALQLVGAVVLCFFPAVGLLLWAMFGQAEISGWAYVAAVAFGCFYFPMAFLALAMFDSVTAINPLVVVPAICKVPLEYLVACFFLGLVVAVRWAGDMALNALIPVIIVPSLISSFVGLYFLTVQCRMLGLLYYTKKERFGWFHNK